MVIEIDYKYSILMRYTTIRIAISVKESLWTYNN